MSAGLAVAPAHAAFLASNDESFSYVGTVTNPDGTSYQIPPYTSTPGTTTYPGRDASIYAASNAPTSDTGDPAYDNYTQFETNWYASADGTDSGAGNPNNTDTGFLQLLDGNTAGATGGWTNSSYTSFTITITGGPTTDPNNRLWAAPEVGGAADDTAGEYETYTLTLTADFAPGDVTEEFPGWYSTTDDPISVTGSFTGTFLNDSLTDPANDGLYSVDTTFTDTNWAGANDIPEPDGSYFGASAVTAAAVPEPSSFAILCAGLFGFAWIGWRRRAS